MKKKVSMVLSILIAVLVVVWIIATIPFAKNIDQEIDAVVYKDGAVIGETAVYMNGKKTRYLFRADSFVGEFRVYYAEKTDVDDLQTKIQWQKDSSIQRISHFYKGNFTTSDERGIECNMMISDDMKDFAVMTTNQEIIATSYEIYDEYCKNLGILKC